MQERVLVGLSLGVDSLATALLLKAEPFSVVGVYFHLHQEAKDLEKVRKICDDNNIEFHYVNLQEEFYKDVIIPFADFYLKGLTPNICSYCNAEFKIEKLLQYAEKFSCNYIATGHYARKNDSLIGIAKDSWKDQSFMLYRLSEKQREKLLLPLGQKMKDEVKDFVRQCGYEEIANKRESFGLCFTNGKHYSEFLLEKYPELKKLENGKVFNKNNQEIGTHKGYPFYTIGQYKGLNCEEKQYINKIIAEENAIFVGEKSDCYFSTLRLNSLVFSQNIENIKLNTQYLTKIRGKDEGNFATLREISSNHSIIEFSQRVFAPMQGQDVVVYDENNFILFGGRIEAFS